MVIVGRQRQQFSVELFRQVSKRQVTTVCDIVYVTLTLQTFIWLDHLVLSPRFMFRGDSLRRYYWFQAILLDVFLDPLFYYVYRCSISFHFQVLLVN